VLTAAVLGFALGLRHAFDPDHVIAVSTLVARHRAPWQASWIGACWGLGHSVTIFAVGAAVIGLHLAIPDGVARSVELVVGVLLVGLGLANLAAVGQARVPDVGDPEPLPLRSALTRSGLVGLAHGLAGSAAIALLAVAAMPTPATAVAYLAVFGAGTIAGMIACSCALAAPFAVLPDADGVRRAVVAATGLASVGFGSYLIYAFGGALAA
jgi:hypothetical protein